MSDGGKGSKQRPTDKAKFDANYDAIFRKSPKEVDDARAEDDEFERIKREFDEKVIMKPDFSE